MKRLNYLYLVLLLVFPLATSAATVAERAQAMIEQGGPNVVQELAELGSSSTEDAAAVMRVVAQQDTRLLEEVLEALAALVDATVFNAAVNLAAEQLTEANAPELSRLLLATASQVAEANFPGGTAGPEDEDNNESGDRIGEDPEPGPAASPS